LENSQLESYFKELTPRQKEQFVSFEKLFLEVNQRINLISRKDHNNFFIHHLLHSLSIANFFKFKSGTDVLDLGTGGGLPGIPLAIMFPEVNFLLCDSIRKKLTAVDEIVEYLQLKNVSTAWQRAETIERRFDFVVSRAVAPIGDLWHWTKKLIHNNQRNNFKNGLILLKGGDLEVEIENWRKSICKNNPNAPLPILDEIELKGFCKDEFFITKKIIYIEKF
jgi:16S rRNA (guanine527-N7)-methyltransferase